LIRLSPQEYNLLRFARHVHGLSIPMRLRELGLADARRLLGFDAAAVDAAVELGSSSSPD
jgi:hypothetical protein